MKVMNVMKARQVSVLLTLFLGSSLVADDTEIFVGRGGSSTGVKPNVLFILDNSGSMSGSSYDEYGRPSKLSRMENMKVAFEDMMQSASGINVGLMTFNGSGGSMLYPVENIDKELPGQDALESNIGMTSGADDAIELKTSGNVYLDDETLTIAHVPNREAGRSLVSFIQHEDDDGEQAISGSMHYSGHYQFNMDSTQLNALRYKDLGIPRGATIVSAHLVFTASRSDSSHIFLRIRGQDQDNPGQFTTSFNDITNRLATSTTSYVDWEMTGFNPWVSGNKYNSPDVSPVIQELVNRPDWDADDAMVLLVEHVTGTGHRAGYIRREDRAHTHGLTGDGTLLHVTYNTGAAANTHQTVGLRFDNIDIPAGATVTSARISFVSAATNPTPDALNIQVKVENSGDAQPFTNAQYNLSSRTKFSDVATWHPDDSWDFNQTVSGPDVTQLVQRVVSDASGWCGGNAMAFYLEPSTASDILSRLAYAYEAGIGKKATLAVSYTGGQDGCIERTWASRINSEENDAYQKGSRSVYNSTSTIPFEDDTLVGLRFENIPVQTGKKVVEAYLELTAADDDTGSATMVIKADDDANAPAFPQSNRNISSRDTTGASVSWTLDNWEDEKTYRSPDISNVINAILSKSDWTAGNAIALLAETNSSNDRDFWSFDGNSGKAARLILRVESGGIPSSTNTVREHSIGIVNNLEPRGMTPVTGALYEAALYYQGKGVDYGQNRDNSRWGRVSAEESWTGGTIVRSAGCTDDDLDSSQCSSEYIGGSPMYTSPISSACQSSHVVVLTDGAANQNDATAKIASLTGDAGCESDASIGGEQCARTLARWMANADLRTDLSGNPNTVKTHTIAFNLSSPVAVNFLQDVANEGDGGFYSVNTAQELSTAFDTILQSVRSTAATFVAPGATVNQFNRLSHRSEVYFSVFKPDANPRWAGNLKRYKLLGSPAVISDANDKAAVDPLTGYFKESAQSVWSDEVDGAFVPLGGAASQRPLDPNNLNMFTWLQNASVSSKDLTANVNKLHESNTAITSGMLGLADASKRTNLLKWMRGVDVKDWDADSNTTEVRTEYEDPLHSVPRIITYGGTNENPDTTIFFGTNGGYLHAIDGATGEEIFSFMPESQISKMETRFDNSDRFTHPYGVDGSPVSWVYDANGDNQIQATDGDFAYLYFGLRRGGNEYFALDVTNRIKPKLLWHIKGGSGDFAQLGQTWSTPVFANIRQGTDIKKVLVFGGGFSSDYDNASYAGASTVGNALYVVDAETGQRLWYASSAAISGHGQRLSDMQYPLPADVSVVDINGDGLAEQIYAADLFGQIFRFDVKPTAAASSWIQGGTIAQLGSPTSPDNRRFFNAPDVSLTSIAHVQKIAIAIGSGSRPNPLSRTTKDRFFMILQDSAYRAPAAYTPVTHADLVNQTTTTTSLTSADAGWYFDLPNSGEKVLSSSITVANKIIMTTYSPDSAASSCNPIVGTGRAYVLNLMNGAGIVDLDGDGTVEDTQDRSKTLASGNIPPSPKVLFPEDGAPVVLVGPEQPLENIDLSLVDEWTQIYRRPEDPN